MRPALKAGLLPVWRDRDTVQIGIDPRRAVALTGLGGAAGVLRLLDGSRDRTQVIAAASEQGIPRPVTERILTLLAAGGALDDIQAAALRSLPQDQRRALAAELAACALARGHSDAGATALVRRHAARVVMYGTGRVAAGIADILVTSGVGRVTVADRPAPAGRRPGPAALDARGRDARPPRPDLVILVGYAALTGDPGRGGPGRGNPARGGPGTRDPGRGDPGRGNPGRGGPGTRDPDRGDWTAAGQRGGGAAAGGETRAADPGRDLAGRLMQAGVPHLAVRAEEAIGVVGPLVWPGATACLRCLNLTRAELDPAWPLILAQLAGRSPDPPACDAALAAAVAAQAAAQALAHLDRGPAAPGAPGAPGASAGGHPAENGTLELVLPGWQWRRRTWPRHPACGCDGHDDLVR